MAAPPSVRVRMISCTILQHKLQKLRGMINPVHNLLDTNFMQNVRNSDIFEDVQFSDNTSTSSNSDGVRDAIDSGPAAAGLQQQQHNNMDPQRTKKVTNASSEVNRDQLADGDPATARSSTGSGPGNVEPTTINSTGLPIDPTTVDAVTGIPATERRTRWGRN